MTTWIEYRQRTGALFAPSAGSGTPDPIVLGHQTNAFAFIPKWHTVHGSALLKDDEALHRWQ
jgi:hypothetical protein